MLNDSMDEDLIQFSVHSITKEKKKIHKRIQHDTTQIQQRSIPRASAGETWGHNSTFPWSDTSAHCKKQQTPVLFVQLLKKASPVFTSPVTLVTKPATIKTKYKWLWFAQAGQQDGACQMEKCLQALDQVLSRGGGKLAQAPGSLPGSWRACSSVNS